MAFAVCELLAAEVDAVVVFVAVVPVREALSEVSPSICISTSFSSRIIINNGVIKSPIPDLVCCVGDIPLFTDIMVDIISLNEDRKSDVEESVLVVCVLNPERPYVEEFCWMAFIIVLTFYGGS